MSDEFIPMSERPLNVRADNEVRVRNIGRIVGRSMDKKSLIQKEKCCYLCGRRDQLHYHHIFNGTANRKLSDKYLLGIWLCPEHHNMSAQGVHFNKSLDLKIKQTGQKAWEAQYRDENGGTAEDARKAFIQIFHKNYIMEEETEPKQRSYVY